MPKTRTHLAVFPGSFDPVTFGHLDVIARGRRLFDEVVVAVGWNPGKDELFSASERVDLVEQLVAQMCKDEPGDEHGNELGEVRVEAFTGLTVDYARSIGASALLRGIRNLSDLQYEVQFAVTNREVAGLETAFVVAGQSFAYTSSSLIKQIAAMGDDPHKTLTSMCPKPVIDAIVRKKKEKHPVLIKLASGSTGD